MLTFVEESQTITRKYIVCYVDGGKYVIEYLHERREYVAYYAAEFSCPQEIKKSEDSDYLVYCCEKHHVEQSKKRGFSIEEYDGLTNTYRAAYLEKHRNEIRLKDVMQLIGMTPPGLLPITLASIKPLVDTNRENLVKQTLATFTSTTVLRAVLHFILS